MNCDAVFDAYSGHYEKICTTPTAVPSISVSPMQVERENLPSTGYSVGEVVLLALLLALFGALLVSFRR